MADKPTSSGCLGVIPGTFVTCGEAEYFCSNECFVQAVKSQQHNRREERLEAERLHEGCYTLENICMVQRHGEERGAAVAFGLMGMAEAIRRTHLRIVEVIVTRSTALPVALDEDEI